MLKHNPDLASPSFPPRAPLPGRVQALREHNILGQMTPSIPSHSDPLLTPPPDP